MSTEGGTPRSHWEGEPVPVCREAWGLPRLEIHDRLPSTNDRVRALESEGAPPFTTVVAEEQTAGRGRSGRRWESPPGLGLWLSLLLPGTGGDESLRYPVLVGLAVARAVEDVVPGPAEIKWPNDVFLRGRKVSGILCESAGGGAGVVAGIGINVRQGADDFPAEIRSSAASLEMLAGSRVSRSRLAGALLRELRGLFDPAPARLEGELASELEGRDLLRGLRVELSTGWVGRARGIGSDGSLRLEDADGRIHPVLAGSVRVVDTERSER